MSKKHNKKVLSSLPSMEESVVVLSVEAYDQLIKPKFNLLQFIQAFLLSKALIDIERDKSLEDALKNRFQNRIIGIDMRISILWGKIQCVAEKKGKPMPAIDSLIAATVIAHDLTVVTRNVTDMEQSGVKLLNPWSS